MNQSTAEQSTGDYNYRIDGQPDFSFLTLQLKANQTIKVEASAMASMDTNIKMKTKMKGGLGRLITGESMFINEFTAQGGPGELCVAPGSPGDLEHVYLNNQTIYLQSSAFVAASPGITVESKWQGLVKGFFSGESMFLIRCSGTGDLWFNTFGGMIRLDNIDESYVVDTGHVVAFTEGLQYTVTRVGNYRSLFFSEGLVCRFSGKGTLWIQTRKIGSFASWIYWYRPVKNRS